VVNQDKLLWVFTDYGLNRQAEALFDNNITLNLIKIKVGDSNGTYYIPSNLDIDLKNIKDSFDVTSVTLSEDSSTVIFRTVIPENSSGYDIREVGLYEVVDGVDYLFALSTCQPIVRGSTSDGYFQAVDYEINFKSVNLSSLYDQISVNPLSNYLTEGELDDIKRSMLYVESNLATQITKNTNVLGLDRPEILDLKIKENTLNTSKIASNSLINTIGSYCTDITNIKLLSLFNCLKNVSAISKIVDFSTNRYNLNLNRNMALMTTGIEMFAPYVDFYPDDYFYLSETDNFSLLKNGVESPLTFLGLVKLDTSSGYKNIFTKIDASTGIRDFSIDFDKSTNILRVVLYSSAIDFVRFQTVIEDITILDKFISIAFTYNGNKLSPSGSIFINGIKQTTAIANSSYTGMRIVSPTRAGSFEINASNVLINPSKSKISLLSVITEQFSDYKIQLLSLEMLALVGEDVCQIF